MIAPARSRIPLPSPSLPHFHPLPDLEDDLDSDRNTSSSSTAAASLKNRPYPRNAVEKAGGFSLGGTLAMERERQGEQRRDGGFFAAEVAQPMRASRREKGGHWLSASPPAMRTSSTQNLFFRMSNRFLHWTSVRFERQPAPRPELTPSTIFSAFAGGSRGSGRGSGQPNRRQSPTLQLTPAVRQRRFPRSRRRRPRPFHLPIQSKFPSPLSPSASSRLVR